MAGSLRVEYLADRPDAIATVAAWEHAQWGHLMPEVALTQITSAFERRAHRDRVPITLLGFAGDELVATASLVVHDMSTRRNLTPWLAIVYVAPARRRRGFGSEIVRAVQREAKALGIETVYLFTPDQMPFYAQLGWKDLETLDYRGERVTIMAWHRNTT